MINLFLVGLLLFYNPSTDIDQINPPVSILIEDIEVPKSIPCNYPEDIINSDINYLDIMIEACVEGDRNKGIEAEYQRNLKIDNNNLDLAKISWDDLYLLSKVITQEAGADWLTDEHQLLVGNVVINRINSSEFPDNLYDVIYQEWQYPYAESEEFNNLLPFYRCVVNASLLLQGNTYCPDSVVFQANYEQGEVYKIITDDILRDTYFCYSSYPELYEN